MLADMSIGVEAARLCYQKSAWQADMVRNAFTDCVKFEVSFSKNPNSGDC